MGITRVQGNSVNSGSLVTSQTVTLGGGIKKGNLVVASVAVGNNTTTISGPTGWTEVTYNQPNGSSATIATSIWYLVVSSSQAGQTSWTWSLNHAHSMYICISEWNATNGWPANPVDVSANGDTIGSPVQATSIASGTTGTTAQAEELWIGSLAYKGSAQSESGVTAGWTSDLEATLDFNNTMTMLYKVAAATGTASVSYTIGTAKYWAGCVVTFKDRASVTPNIAVSPASMSFSAAIGGANPPVQNDTLSEVNGAATAWTSSITYFSGSGWLAISPTSGSLGANGNANIVVTCTTGALTGGTYTANITFTATTGGDTAVIAVTFTIAGPALSVSPTSQGFTGQVSGVNPTSKQVTITEGGGVATAWTSSMSGSPAWITLTPSSGSVAAFGTSNVTLAINTVGLTTGSYTTTITFTATTGGSTATVAVTLTMLAYAGGFSIILAGQDITSTVDQTTIDAIDALGQGSGAGAAPTFQGRQSTIKLNTSLGPANSALGAGQTLPGGGPYLVRQGQLLIKDSNGNIVWAGYATKYTDITTGVYAKTSVQPFTTIEGTDYDAALDRILVNASYVALTDVQIITQTIQKYAPWIGLSFIPAIGVFTFPVKNFRNVSVQKLLRTIAGITGYMIWVDFNQQLHYVALANAQSAPFGLSDTPDFITTFPHNVQEFVIDDNSVINRVTFYGGRHNSGDFTQDVSPLANGSNKVFPLAYYPHPTSDGKYHVLLNGVEQVIGDVNGAQTPANTFVSQGGLANVLMNSDAHTVTFDIAPASGATVLVKYQYDFPLSLIVTSQASYQYFGPPYLDGYLSDDTVFDTNTALQRAKVLLSQQAFGLVTLKIDCWQPGLRSGMTVNVQNTVRALSGPYLVQQVEMEPVGSGVFVFHLTLGSWDWNLLDVMMKLANATAPSDTSQTEVIELVDINSAVANANVTSSWTKNDTLYSSPHYARATALGDGHDSFPGFATITS